ncbi:hypothetical protein [Nocardioides sp. Soil796]|uniref:hypothetical protein n=1 Tax=Nocardioides sp. Soil796 TaxID=1736412 RepID=UPI00070BC1CC|nr:hypothetical protein [Nocardioides sp. Soil796]KRF19660.1 hypothetical protein ASH02_24200 [Nocardioides sp. Soil796]
MSAAEVRQALADAASTVEGITCFPYYKQMTKPGGACVRKDRTEYPNDFGGVNTWQVVVILPQDQAAAEKFMDEKTPLLVAALSPEMRVTEAYPTVTVLPDGGSAVNTVLIQGNREEE